MDISYSRPPSRQGKAHKARGAGRSLGQRERRRLLQLGTCLVLFLVMFWGRDLVPGGPAGLRALLGENTDFAAAFETLGQAITGDASAAQAIQAMWQGQVEPAEESGGDGSALPLSGEDPGVGARFAAWAASPDDPVSAAFHAGAPEVTETVVEEQQADSLPQAQDTRSAQREEELETVQPQAATEDGQALPASVTLLEYPLGLEETAVPVMGVVSSDYGYRDHPASGDYTFHRGVDLAADKGTPILAFADGVVDCIGESEDSGLYTQILHDNGVVTFYAHCDTLLVHQGDEVKAGDTIATVGETGNATGPHLHFAVKKDGVYLDPLYYLALS